MRPSSIFAASASLLSLAHARIAGIGVPSTIKPGDTFDLIIENEIYIQSVTDVAIAVGYATGDAAYAGSLGIFVTAFDLVADSNAESNYNKSVTLPEDAALGESTFSASLTSLYGVQYTPSLAFFNVTFTVGDETSEDYVYGNAS